MHGETIKVKDSVPSFQTPQTMSVTKSSRLILIDGNAVFLLLRTLVHIITYLLTPWCRVLLEKLTGLQLVKKFLVFFMEPEGSLPHSQASATSPYSGPAQSSPHTHIPPPGDPS